MENSFINFKISLSNIENRVCCTQFASYINWSRPTNVGLK